MRKRITVSSNCFFVYTFNKKYLKNCAFAYPTNRFFPDMTFKKKPWKKYNASGHDCWYLETIFGVFFE